MHLSSAIHQYVAVNIWSKGGFCQRRSPSFTYFCPPLIHPLEYLAKNTTRTVTGKRFLPNGPFSAFFNDFEIFIGPFLINLHRLLWAMGLWRMAPYLPNHCQNGSIPSKAFCLWSSLTSCPALDPPQGGSDKKPQHICGPWELHPYQIS